MSRSSGFPIANEHQHSKPMKEAGNSEDWCKGKSFQDEALQNDPSVSENKVPKSHNGTNKRLFDQQRMKVSKLKMAPGAPIIFHQLSQEDSSMSQILDFLYIGNAKDSKNAKVLMDKRITHVINATYDLPNFFEEEGKLKYLRVEVEDSGTADLMPHFRPVIDFIDEAVRSGGRVLVHCQEGVSRSASLVIAYIMAHSNLTLMHAIEVVSHARAIIFPNINFLGQLNTFYNSLQYNFVPFCEPGSFVADLEEILLLFFSGGVEASPAFQLINTKYIPVSGALNVSITLALRTSEYEVESLQSRYKEAAEMFTRTSKAAEVFADALNGLCRCLNSLVTPSPKLPIGIDREADIQRIIRSIYSFSNIVNDFSSCVLQSRTVISQADLKLEELQSTRKDFTRAGESVEAAINKAAGISRSRTSDAKEADNTLLNARTTYAQISEVYLSQLRTVLRPIRLSIVLRATVNTFEMQQSFSNKVAALNQSEKCVATLRKSIAEYEAEALNQVDPTLDGISSSPTPERGIRYEGYLFKRSKKKRWRNWVRRWFMVTDNRLVYFSSFSDTYTSLIWKILEPDLRLCTAKAVSSSGFGSGDLLTMPSSNTNITDRRFVFELISPTGRVHYLQAESAEALGKWVSVLKSGIINSTCTNGEMCSSSLLVEPSPAGSRDSLRSLSGIQLLDEPAGTGNRFCADCFTSHEVKWASTNLGVTLCTDCAACHRSLGVHISKSASSRVHMCLLGPCFGSSTTNLEAQNPTACV
ncbi:hypothetical protein Aperf_G00000072822 [Anoplocephala perfoliata]